ncbi:MAG TPA: HAMP domain-containing sensor histidine kinase [Candidatus Dormibacteraeota bacterium]|nr:HAMP domain-containing sensor histidine kinase [Candidatus Dormibacteraeota bacterium]
MKSKIVVKLFILTSLLCMFILAAVFMGQTFFFKHYYVQKKETEIAESIDQFEREFLLDEANDARRAKEQVFYEQTNTWITVLDEYGRTTNMGDFYVELDVQFSSHLLKEEDHLQIPLSSLMSPHDALDDEFSLLSGSEIIVYGIQTDSTIIPYAMSEGNIPPLEILEIAIHDNMLYEWRGIRDTPFFQSGSSYWENKQFSNRVSHEINKHVMDMPDPDVELIILEETEGDIHAEGKSAYLEFGDSRMVFMTGTIREVHVPTYKADQMIMDFNHSFIDQLHTFQTSLLFNDSLDHVNDSSLTILEEELNGIPHKIFIHPFQVDAQTYYVFAMTSLQPVDEVLQVMEDYFIYLIIIVMVLVLMISFYYSKKIANPLLKINETTEKMARLDFSESIPLHSRDELGTLSRNINTLSDIIHNYIVELQDDIEKEKQLEHTRKEFVSGVSHELKTPLSIMKSTLAILQSEIALDKRAYYFQALEQEVDRMDRLVVDMLDLAKYESGTYQIKLSPFYMDEVIQRVCKQLSLSAQDKKVHLHLDVYPVRVTGNEHLIEQVITNFVTNAIRHTDEHGDIWVSMDEAYEQVKVCVENSGALIENDQIDKVWNRFYRGDVSRHRTKGETGLGLAISKNILEHHGSSYGVENTDRGVLFYFYLQKDNGEE